jgi:hypothetical protein
MTFCPLVPPLYEARVTDWIRRSLFMHPEIQMATSSSEEVEEAVRCKRDPHFDKLRNNRLRMGHLRYGRLGYSASTDACMRSIIARAQAYLASPNREHLLDIANLAEIVWCQCGPEGSYFHAQDGDSTASLRVQQGDVKL